MVLTAFVRGRVRPRTSGSCSWDVLKLVGRVEGAISFGQRKLRVPCLCLLSGSSRSIEDSCHGHEDEFLDPRLKESLASTEATKPPPPNSTIREALRVLGSLERELQSESTTEWQNRRNRRTGPNLGKSDSSTAAQDAYETYAATLAQEGRIDDVFGVLHRHEKRKRPVSLSLYRSLLLSLRRTQGLHGDERVDLVLQTMRRMKEEGLTLGREEYLTLLSVMARTRNRQNLTLAAGKIQSMGIDLEWKEYAQLMVAFARQGEVQEARALFKAVIQRFFQPQARGHGRWSHPSRPSSLENDGVGLYNMLKSDTEDVPITKMKGKTANSCRVSSKEGVTNIFAPVSGKRVSDGAQRSSPSEDSKVKLKFVDALIRCLGKNRRGEEALWALWAFKEADPELEVNQRVLHSLLKALVISGNFETAVTVAKYVGSLRTLPPIARPHRSNTRVADHVLSKQNRRNWEIFISSDTLARQTGNDRHNQQSFGAREAQSDEEELHIGLEVERQRGLCDEQIRVSLPKLFRGSSVHLDPKAAFVVLDAMLQEGRTGDVGRFSEYIWQHRRASPQLDAMNTRPHGIHGTHQKHKRETIDDTGDLLLHSYLHRLRGLKKRGDWQLIKVLTNESLRLVEMSLNDEHGGEHENSGDGRSLTSSNDGLAMSSGERLCETVSSKSGRDWRKKESLLLLYAKARRSDSVRDLYLQLVSESEPLTRASFEALIEMYCRQGEVEKAMAMLEIFLKKRVSNSEKHCEQSKSDSNRAQRTVEGYVTVQIGSETAKDMEIAFGLVGRKASEIKSHLNCDSTNLELGKRDNQQGGNQRNVGNDSQIVMVSDVLANDGPRARTFAPLLRYFIKFRDAEGVEWVLDKMKKENIGLALSDSVQLLRYYVSEFSDRSDIALLDFVFKKLPQCGCSMDNVLCTELLKAFNRARGSESRERCAAAAKTLMKKVEAAAELRPDKLYYSTLLSIFCKAQWLKEVTHVVEMMNASFLYLGIDDCNNIISACCQSGNRKLAEAILIYLELASDSRKGGDLQLRSSKSSGGRSMRSGSSGVVDLPEQIDADIAAAVRRPTSTHPVEPGTAGGGLDPTEHWAPSLDGQTEDATWHHTVEKRVLQISMAEIPNAPPFFAGSSSVDQKVRAPGEEESSSGTEKEALPDSRVWQDLALACEKALQLSVNDVIDLQTTHPDSVTYGCFMQYHGERGQIEEMEKYLNRMQERGVRPNSASFNILLSAYGRSARSQDEFPREKLLRTIEMFRTQQISASHRTHSILLRLVRDGVIE